MIGSASTARFCAVARFCIATAVTRRISLGHSQRRSCTRRILRISLHPTAFWTFLRNALCGMGAALASGSSGGGGGGLRMRFSLWRCDCDTSGQGLERLRRTCRRRSRRCQRASKPRRASRRSSTGLESFHWWMLAFGGRMGPSVSSCFLLRGFVLVRRKPSSSGRNAIVSNRRFAEVVRRLLPMRD